MAEFTETTTKTINCPYCPSEKVSKYGKQQGHQRYVCDGCRRTFTDTGKLHGHRFTADQIGAAVRMFYSGTSYKQIAEYLEEVHDVPEPSKATIYEWVRNFTDRAVGQMKGRKAHTGKEWVADEMMVDVGGQKMWLWNVMDSETRYVLASHLTPRRDANAARVVLRKAALAAAAPPKTIVTDKLKSYMPAVKDVLPETRHMQSEGMTADINNNLSERLQGTFRDRIKTLRGLDSSKTGQRYLDGWTLQYNLFRDHESLRGDRPGKRAKVNPPFTEWSDVVKAGAASRRKVKAGTRPASRSKPKSPQPEAAPVREARERKPLREITPEGERRRKPGSGSRLRMPKPAYPRASGAKPRKQKVKPPWVRQRPRLPSRA